MRAGPGRTTTSATVTTSRSSVVTRVAANRPCSHGPRALVVLCEGFQAGQCLARGDGRRQFEQAAWPGIGGAKPCAPHGQLAFIIWGHAEHPAGGAGDGDVENGAATGMVGPLAPPADHG